MKSAAIALLVAATAAPGLAPPRSEEPDAILIQPGDTFTCTHPSGCVLTTPEMLQAALRAVHAQGARSCRL